MAKKKTNAAADAEVVDLSQRPTPADANEAAAAAAVERKGGKLTRQGMEQVIKNGGSVSIGGNTISRIEDLPSEAEIAEGDAEAEATALANLDRQQAALDAQRTRLTKKK